MCHFYFTFSPMTTSAVKLMLHNPTSCDLAANTLLKKLGVVNFTTRRLSVFRCPQNEFTGD